MSNSSEIYKKVKPSIVAIVAKLSRNPDFPDIIGTGFIVHEDGVILTNNHVIKAITNLPRRKDEPDSVPIRVMLFRNTPEGMLSIPLEVEAVTSSKLEKVQGVSYGEEIPDIGAIYVKAKGLPIVEIDEKLNVEEGDNVLVSGFPMGTTTLRSAGWIHQLSPVLQKGIVSAILPFVCESPHAIIVEAVTQGGSSGSPIFNIENGKVTAILFAGLPETKVLAKTDDGKLITYTNNTSLTYAIPSPLLHIMYKRLLSPIDPLTNKELVRDVSSYKRLEEIISSYNKIVHKPREINMEGVEPIYPNDVIEPGK